MVDHLLPPFSSGFRDLITRWLVENPLDPYPYVSHSLQDLCGGSGCVSEIDHLPRYYSWNTTGTFGTLPYEMMKLKIPGSHHVLVPGTQRGLEHPHHPFSNYETTTPPDRRILVPCPQHGQYTFDPHPQIPLSDFKYNSKLCFTYQFYLQ